MFDCLNYMKQQNTLELCQNWFPKSMLGVDEHIFLYENSISLYVCLLVYFCVTVKVSLRYFETYIMFSVNGGIGFVASTVLIVKHYSHQIFMDFLLTFSTFFAI